MRLNAKIGLVLLVPTVLMAGAMAWVLRSEIGGRFLELERSELVQHHERLLQAMEAEMNALSRLVTDWGIYDETYAYMAGENPTFVQANLTAATFANLQVEGILMIDQQGGVVGSFGYDPARQREQAIAPAVIQEIAALYGPGSAARDRGLLAVNGQLLQIASSDIVDSEDSQPSRGTLVMLRTLDQGVVDQLARRTRLTLAFLPLRGEAAVPADVLAELENVPLALRIDDEDHVSSWSLLPDLHGAPALLMRVSMPRGIVQQGRAAVADLLLFTVGVTALLLLSTFIALRRVALQRLSRLARRLGGIAHQPEVQERLPVRGDDEIDRVAAAVNGMLDALHAADQQRRVAGERQRELNTLLVRMATDDALASGEPEALLRLLRGTLQRVAALAGWSLWLQDSAGVLQRLGRRDHRDEEPLSPSELLSLPGDADVPGQLLRLPGSAQRPTCLLFPLRIEQRRGVLCTWLEAAAPLPDDDQVNFLIAATELIEHGLLTHAMQARERDLRRQTETDLLTGLANRLGLERTLQEVRSDGSHAALLFIDLDRFKPVNDLHGHAVGDWLLCQVAERLRERLRGGDLVARIGGDEFCVLLRGLKDDSGAAQVADKLLDTLGTPFLHPQAGLLQIGASIGIALHPLHGAEPAELLHAADMAMYTAKQAGRHAWRLAEQKLG
jgi:diguanylate cyclase (GGDEF)-like protein